MLLDTNIIIDYFRGSTAASRFLETYKTELSTSSVVVMETIVGLKKKVEIRKIDKFLISFNIRMYFVTQTIAEEAIKILSENFHSSGMGALDAFVAATAKVTNQEVATSNLKHFRCVEGVKSVRPY